MTVTYRPTQDEDPQEPESQHNAGAGPSDGMESDATLRLSEPIRRKVVIKPPATPTAGTRFPDPESSGQNPSTMQKQVVEQLPTGALPNLAPLSSNRAQTIEQLRAAALSAPPAPGGRASNWQQGVDRRPVQSAAPAVPAASNWQQQVEQARTAALPGASPRGTALRAGTPACCAAPLAPAIWPIPPHPLK